MLGSTTKPGKAMSEDAKAYKDELVKSLNEELVFKRTLDQVYVLNEDFQQKYHGSNDHFTLPRIGLLRTKNSITINVEQMTIQIILRLYSSPSEVLHGFDLGSSAVGYDGSQVWLTSLGMLSYSSMINVVDTTRRSTTYERRLRKYFDRGFMIVLPHLDVNKIDRRNHKWNQPEVVDLNPQLTFSCNSVSGNNISLSSWLSSGYSEVMDQDASVDYGLHRLDFYRAAHMNTVTLIKGSDNFYWTAEGWDATVFCSPNLNIKMIQNCYRILRSTIFKEGKLHTKAISEFINVKTLPEICTELFKDGMNMVKRRGYLMELLDEQLAVSIELFRERFENKDFTQLDWITVDPQTQLSGSINPIITNPQEYYNEYFRSMW
ncbi:hypothetical protein GEMRC1_014204 [Eukaryota sp. GEM-RC1]